MSKNNY